MEKEPQPKQEKTFEELKKEIIAKGHVYNFLDGEGEPEHKELEGDLSSYISKEKLMKKFEERGGRYEDSRELILNPSQSEEEKSEVINKFIQDIFETLYAKDISNEDGYIKPTVSVERYFNSVTGSTGWALEERAKINFSLNYNEYKKESEE